MSAILDLFPKIVKNFNTIEYLLVVAPRTGRDGEGGGGCCRVKGFKQNHGGTVLVLQKHIVRRYMKQRKGIQVDVVWSYGWPRVMMERAGGSSACHEWLQ